LPSQIILKPLAPANSLVHGGGEEMTAIAPRCLGLMKRHVGELDQLIGTIGIARKQCNTDGSRGTDCFAINLKRLGHGLDQAFRHALNQIAMTQLGTDDGKFIASQTGNRVRIAAAVGQPGCSHAQYFITYAMAVGVIDILEVI
jgi:hypothetical protein